MRPGRAPTRIGGDGIRPFLDVPHWFSLELSRVLRHHRVEFEIRHGYVRRVGSDEPDEQRDRFVFPVANPDFVQSLVNSIKPRDVE